ncbi:MAG: hypothetical protein AAFX59_04145, partial [Pseudomonadota bacterium]
PHNHRHQPQPANRQCREVQGNDPLQLRARAAGLEDAALRAQLQKVVTLNLAALAICGLGLMAVIVGLFLS